MSCWHEKIANSVLVDVPIFLKKLDLQSMFLKLYN